MFLINGRFSSHRVTGMQRYAHELIRRFVSRPELIEPGHPLVGVSGHLWEQFVLPRRLQSRLLWSPCNTGPILTENQVVTIHDIIPLERPDWFSKRFVLLYNAIVPKLLRRVRHVIAVSEFTKDRIVKRLRIPEKKISVIPNGVGEEFTPASDAEIARVRSAYGIPTGPYVLSLSSLEPRKNLHRLLAAWPKVAQNRADITLVVAGATGSRSVFKDVVLPSSLRQVVITGYVADSDLPALYSGATCFAYPSLYEGFGLPVIEALACGTSVVASNCSSIPEIAGDSAILIDPLSVSEIASALNKFLDGHKILLNAEKIRPERFSWARCVKSTEASLLSFC